MELKDRILQIIEYTQMTSSEFADEIEVQRSNISHIMSGRNKPSLDFIIKIKDRFPEVSWDWLIKGNGEMLQSTNELNATPSQLNDETDFQEPVKNEIPDLFSFVSNDSKSDETIIKSEPIQTQRELNIPNLTSEKTEISDSRPLDPQEILNVSKPIDNQNVNIKRIVIFYDNGKFESFEP